MAGLPEFQKLTARLSPQAARELVPADLWDSWFPPDKPKWMRWATYDAIIVRRQKPTPAILEPGRSRPWLDSSRGPETHRASTALIGRNRQALAGGAAQVACSGLRILTHGNQRTTPV
jgi:hypothetical protein